MTNDHSDLLPHDLTLGWTDLQGQHRFAQRSDAPSDRLRLQTFVEGMGLRVAEGDITRLRIQAVRFNWCLTAHVVSGPFVVEWSRQRVNARNRCVFLFVNRGAIEITGPGSYWSADGGGLHLIFPTTDPVSVRAVSDVELIFFSFDMTEIEPVRLVPDGVGDIAPTDTVFRAAYAYLQAAAFQSPTGEEEDLGVLRSLTRDVARALVLASTSSLPGADLFTRAQARISHEYRNPQFSPSRLARDLDVSRSTLERAYRARDLRVAQEIRRHRARHAMALFASGPDLALDLVAAASGFGSRSSLQRAFEDVYGTPIDRTRFDGAAIG
ncbi:AraC family transcriptional regulator [Microbacterium sp. T32]|uniref:AraC family transcriptional regulator n=1 Tax=Microbacterium sp. T32 TaxID=1776083 RepID=UPI0007AC2BCD|nr:helix-turn-helix domain-containing protein [Microbacterium sp. T32]KZE41765.1 hypothetical protein AVW09_12105 [Microbacterium sp. T32]